MRLHRHRALRWMPCALALLAACSSGGDDGPSTQEQSIAMTGSAIDQLNLETSAGLTAALSDLESAVALDPQNGLAQLLLGGVRLAAFVDDNRMPTDGSPPSGMAALMSGFGVDLGGASVFDMMDQLEQGTMPAPTDVLPLPDDAPQVSDLQDFLAGDLLDVVVLSAANWEQVPPGFSEVVPSLLGMSFEVDYGDARFLAAAARGVEALLRLQSAFVLEADIDELANWQFNGLAFPYRLFTGDSPSNIIIGQTTAAGRKGFMNEPLLTDSADTFLPGPDADQTLAAVQQALVSAVLDLQAGLAYVEDPDPTDDLIALDPAILCPVNLAAPWIADLLQALQGGDMVVAPLSAADPVDPECAIELPGFTLDASLLFSSSTWDGRLFFPDYPDGTTVAVETSWDHLLNDPELLQLLAGFGASAPEGADVLALWNGLNGLWDLAFAGEPLEEEY